MALERPAAAGVAAMGAGSGAEERAAAAGVATMGAGLGVEERAAAAAFRAAAGWRFVPGETPVRMEQGQEMRRGGVPAPVVQVVVRPRAVRAEPRSVPSSTIPCPLPQPRRSVSQSALASACIHRTSDSFSVLLGSFRGPRPVTFARRAAAPSRTPWPPRRPLPAPCPETCPWRCRSELRTPRAAQGSPGSFTAHARM